MGSNVFNDLNMIHFFDSCSQTCDKLVINIHKVCYIRDTLKGTTSQISNKNKDQRLVYISQGRDKSPFPTFAFQDLVTAICILGQSDHILPF